ncbi:MAG: biotin transporter BioY [Acidimicrobiia bacterium]|nr:MAG: biotin transporter BioY [Acidimicrobiia bacterium]
MQTTYPSRTLANVFVSRTAVNTVALMIGFALLTALAAQIRFHIPGTPVPVTGQTFAVLLAGAALGSRAGAGSQLIYWLMGAVGLPVFAQAEGGWGAATGATFGYLFGFVVAAWLVGALAERGQDRSVRSAIPAFLAGNLVIYAFGVPWLMYSIPAIDTLGAALAAGFMPFVAFDAIKIVLAGVALPAAWKMTANR